MLVAIAIAAAGRPSEMPSIPGSGQRAPLDAGSSSTVAVRLAVASGAATTPDGATQTAAAVTSIAMPNLDLMKRQAAQVDARFADASVKVLSINPVSRSDADRVEPRLGAIDPENPDAGRLVWIVRAEGAFFGGRVPPGAKPIVGTTGYIVIDDETGLVVGMGTP